MTLQATKQFYDARQGHIYAGEVFDEPSARTAKQLMASGLATIPMQPQRLTYSTKILVPAEVKAQTGNPFRYGDNADDGGETEVDSSCDSLLPQSNVQEQRTADSGRRRRGRPRKYPISSAHPVRGGQQVPHAGR